MPGYNDKNNKPIWSTIGNFLNQIFNYRLDKVEESAIKRKRSIKNQKNKLEKTISNDPLLELSLKRRKSGKKNDSFRREKISKTNSYRSNHISRHTKASYQIFNLIKMPILITVGIFPIILDLFSNLFGKIYNFKIISVSLLTVILLTSAWIIGSDIINNEMSDYANHNEMIKNDEWKDYIRIYRDETKHDSIKSKIYTVLPWRLLSRSWGRLNQKTLPKTLRVPVYSFYIYMTGVNLSEAANQKLSSYKCLNSFFRRQMKNGVREISTLPHKLVSPVDGRILSNGRISDNEDEKLITQVKGINYSLKALLGPVDGNSSQNFSSISDFEYKNLLLRDSENNDLFYSVIYLAPGDYHRFHSPTEFKVQSRRHFPGDLFSVNGKVTSWLKNLFALNERVVLNGEWKHGFFSYTAVGASLVGSIKMYHDDNVKTSKPYATTKAHNHNGIYFDKTYNKPINFDRADQIGEFNIGSTVIMVFEAPKNFKFSVQNGQKVQLGQPFDLIY